MQTWQEMHIYNAISRDVRILASWPRVR